MKRILLFALSALLCAAAVAAPENDKNQGASFPAGKFKEWVEAQVVYPRQAFEQGIKGQVRVAYTIGEDGLLTDFVVSYSADPLLDGAVIEALRSSPAWEPAMRDGVPVTNKGYVDVLFTGSGVTTDLPQTKPTFNGSDITAFRQWVMQQVRYPREEGMLGISGRVRVSFAVETDGSLSVLEVLETPGDAFSLEVVRILDKSPLWTPGMIGEYPVRIKFTIPVDFRLKK